MKEFGNRLNEVHWERVVDAMGSTSDAYFVVWQSEADDAFKIPEPLVTETQQRVADITEQILLKLSRKHPRRAKRP
jgi:hypothetical protein